MKFPSPGRGAAASILCIAAWLAAAPLHAQTPAQVDSLRREVDRLRVQVDSLLRVVGRLQAELAAAAPVDTAAVPADTTVVADDLAALRAAARAAAGGAPADTVEEPPPERFVGRQRSQQALNPEITVTGDVFALMDMDEPDHGNFVPREFEVSLQSALDPFTLAKVFVGFHLPGGEILPFEHHEEEVEPPPGEEEEEHGHAGEVEVEEGYLQWTALPGGLNVSLGKFRQMFGTLNRWHPHALPGQSYPLPYLAFFGEHGLAQTGVSVHWLAPWSGVGAWEFWTEVTASGNETLFGEAAGPSVLGRVNAFWDLTRSTYFELGVSGIAGPDHEGDDAFATRVAGADFALSWRPPLQGRSRELTVRGGAVLGSVGTPAPEPGSAFGAFGTAELRLSQRWIVGGRYEYTENPMEPDESAWLAAPTLTWWQSEWVRLRAEFDWLERPEGALRQLVLQATFAMGPHKHETY